MKTRIDLRNVLPAAYKPLIDLDKFVYQTGIDRLQLEMIKIRASQINGCAYCMNKHIEDALKYGEEPRRIYVMSAWREAVQWFSEEDRVILSMTEEITNIADHGLSDETYERAIALFGEEKTGQVLIAIVNINAWNRIGVALNKHPV
jgi:AhpD family alkylhydroperoxidase